MKKILCGVLSAIMVFSSVITVSAQGEGKPFDLEAKSAVLMEAETGTVLYEKNPDEALPPASVTKVMTLLLISEAIDSGKIKLTDEVSVSEYAASMGGSQVFLEPNETMTAEDLLKSVIVSSANDAAVALAEYVCGSEETFVSRMNERAKELGMKSTSFENVTGLDDDTKNHVTSARDIALMSRELIVSHPWILNYSSIWMDSIRNGEFTLSNTNRLIRFYNGATGLKTGSTSKAGFCISATAKRDGMHLIAVIMGSETRDERNNAAKKLLDYGFAGYSLYADEGGECESIAVTGGKKEKIKTERSSVSLLVKKNSAVTPEYKIPEKIKAPVKKGDVIGKVIYECDGKIIGESPVRAKETSGKSGFFDILSEFIAKYMLLG